MKDKSRETCLSGVCFENCQEMEETWVRDPTTVEQSLQWLSQISWSRKFHLENRWSRDRETMRKGCCPYTNRAGVDVVHFHLSLVLDNHNIQYNSGIRHQYKIYSISSRPWQQYLFTLSLISKSNRLTHKS